MALNITGEWSDCDRHPDTECYRFLCYADNQYTYDCEVPEW